MADPRPEFPELSGTEATRDTLHAYSRILGALRRAHAPPHERWWHVSLRIEPHGMAMPPTPCPGNPAESFAVRMDLVDHRLGIIVSDADIGNLDMREGMSAAALGDRVIHLLRGAGVDVAPDRERYGSEDPRPYDPAHAAAWLAAFRAAECALRSVREAVSGERGPIQLWSHHFDLSFEGFGTRVVTYVEDGVEHEAVAQVGCGFSPLPSATGGQWPYFYATPWPFDDSLREHALPCEAAWVTEGWDGALLPYGEALSRGQEAVREFGLAVFELARSRMDQADLATET